MLTKSCSNHALSSITRLSARTTFVLALLWWILSQDVNTVFTVANGSELSSCDHYLGSLGAQFAKAIAIGAADLAVIKTIQAKTMSRS